MSKKSKSSSSWHKWIVPILVALIGAVGLAVAAHISIRGNQVAPKDGSANKLALAPVRIAPIGIVTELEALPTAEQRAFFEANIRNRRLRSQGTVEGAMSAAHSDENVTIQTGAAVQFADEDGPLIHASFDEKDRSLALADTDTLGTHVIEGIVVDYDLKGIMQEKGGTRRPVIYIDQATFPEMSVIPSH